MEAVGTRLDLLATREALAVLLIARNRRDEALAELAAIAADLRKAVDDGRMLAPIADRAASVAAIYDKLGKADLAAEMNKLVEEADSRDEGPHMGPGGRGPGRMRGPARSGDHP